MQLSASAVDWDKLEHLQHDGSVDEAVWNSSDELSVGEPPWPSDSTMQIVELSECYEAIKDHLKGETRSRADNIMDNLIHKSFTFPWELTICERGNHIIGAISPPTIREYLDTFSKLDYGELDDAFDSRMPRETRDSNEIAKYPSEEVFTGYLRQWEELFKYAAARNAGVLLHCG